jgi:hypothetical protein
VHRRQRRHHPRALEAQGGLRQGGRGRRQARDPKDPKLKDPKDWKIAGKSMRRLDVPDKVRGMPVFGVDVQLPNMLHASIVQSPVFLGKVKSSIAPRPRRCAA